MKRKTLIILSAVFVLVLASAFAVSAQDDTTDDTTDTTTAPFGFGWMHRQWATDGSSYGPGMMMGMGYGMMWTDQEPMIYAIAEALGMEVDELYAAFTDGQTLAEIAEAQGVEITTLHNVMLSQAAAHMVTMAESGYITQEQADAHLAWMSENIDSMPMFSGTAPCLSGTTSTSTGFGMGRGMMGRGRGRSQ